MNDQTQVTDYGDLRKYRTEIPNIIDDAELTVYAFRLYVHLKRVAGDAGTCWQSTRTLAKACRMSPSQVSRAKDELVVRGYILVTQGNPARNESDRIVITDVWQENFETYFHPVPDRNTPVPDRNRVSLPETEERTIEEKPNEETKKSGASKPPPRAKPYLTRDPNLNHGSVIIYRNTCHLTPNHEQRAKMVQRITDFVVWKDVCEAFMTEGRPPQRVDWLLERYQNRIEGKPGETNFRNRPETSSERTVRNLRERDYTRFGRESEGDRNGNRQGENQLLAAGPRRAAS